MPQMSALDATFFLIAKLLLINERSILKLREYIHFISQNLVHLKPFKGDICNFTAEETETQKGEGTRPRAMIQQDPNPGVLGTTPGLLPVFRAEAGAGLPFPSLSQEARWRPAFKKACHLSVFPLAGRQVSFL